MPPGQADAHPFTSPNVVETGRFPRGDHSVIIKNKGTGTRRAGAALSERSTVHSRGQAPARADMMIEQNPMDERRKGSAPLDETRLRQRAIGVKLRQMFDEVVNEPVPDEFLDILRKADDKSGDR